MTTRNPATPKPLVKPAGRKPAVKAPAAKATPIRKQAEKHLLRLYVAGTTPQSTRAILNIQNICEEHLKGRYQLEVIDIYQRPQLAKDEQIIAVPTLVKRLPEPLRRLIGSFSDSERVLVGLDLLEPGTAGRG
jgi:circadian clock protein KaiB